MISMYADNWKNVFLKQNPFPSGPPRFPEEIIWAGFPNLKKQLDELYEKALTTSKAQIVLCKGEHGSGKTHAAAFACREDYLATFQAVQQVQGAQIFSLRLPKETECADELFYRNILETAQFPKLRLAVKNALASDTPTEALEKLQQLSGNGTIAKALLLLGTEKQGEEINEQQEKLERYFFSQTNKSDLKKLGLSRDIKSAQDRFLVLACLLQCLIGLKPVEDIKAHKRVILWIDEMEDLFLYSFRYFKPFMRGFYDLIDRLPNYFTVIMNFNMDSLDDTHEIEATAGSEFLDRITHEICFTEPNEEQAFEYLIDLLAAYRTEKPEEKGLPLCYPFEEAALRSLIADISSRVPRRLNQRCADVISKAFQIGLFTAPGVGIINKDFVRTVQERHL